MPRASGSTGSMSELRELARGLARIRAATACAAPSRSAATRRSISVSRAQLDPARRTGPTQHERGITRRAEAIGAADDFRVERAILHELDEARIVGDGLLHGGEVDGLELGREIAAARRERGLEGIDVRLGLADALLALARLAFRGLHTSVANWRRARLSWSSSFRSSQTLIAEAVHRRDHRVEHPALAAQHDRSGPGCGRAVVWPSAADRSDSAMSVFSWTVVM